MSKGLLLLSLNCGEIHVTTVLICVAVMFWSGGQYTTSGPELSANKMNSLKRVVQICHKLRHAIDLEVEIRHKCMLRYVWSTSARNGNG